MQIKWLRKALENLDHEATYIAQTDPSGAKKVVETILSSVATLTDNPSMGRPGRVVGTRELVVTNTRYLIPYRVNTQHNRVEILRVFHTSRKTPA
ncbi:MAG: type II toxin-antitoxin system RelE/ParE family toxin, partial [Marinobacterium sp.]